MTVTELMAAIEGVPDEALPTLWFHDALNAQKPDAEPVDATDIHAAVGSMVAWLVSNGGTVKIAPPGPKDQTWYVHLACVGMGHSTPTLIEALAAACRAVNTGDKE